MVGVLFDWEWEGEKRQTGSPQLHIQEQKERDAERHAQKERRREKPEENKLLKVLLIRDVILGSVSG